MKPKLVVEFGLGKDGVISELPLRAYVVDAAGKKHNLDKDSRALFGVREDRATAPLLSKMRRARGQVLQ